MVSVIGWISPRAPHWEYLLPANFISPQLEAELIADGWKKEPVI